MSSAEPAEWKEQKRNRRCVAETLRGMRLAAVCLGWIEFVVAGQNLLRRPVIDRKIDRLRRGLSRENDQCHHNNKGRHALQPDRSHIDGGHTGRQWALNVTQSSEA